MILLVYMVLITSRLLFPKLRAVIRAKMLEDYVGVLVRFSVL